jgi:hypothetical protein
MICKMCCSTSAWQGKQLVGGQAGLLAAPKQCGIAGGLNLEYA